MEKSNIEPSAPFSEEEQLPSYDEAVPTLSPIVEIKEPYINLDVNIKNFYLNNMLLLTFYICATDDINNFAIISEYLAEPKHLIQCCDDLKKKRKSIVLIEKAETPEKKVEMYWQLCADISILYNAKRIMQKCIKIIGNINMILLCNTNIVDINKNHCYDHKDIGHNHSDKSLTCWTYNEYYMKNLFQRNDLQMMLLDSKNKIIIINELLIDVKNITEQKIINLIIKNPNLNYLNFKKIKDFHSYIPIFKENSRFTILKQYFAEFTPIDDNIEYILKNYKELKDEYNLPLTKVVNYQEHIIKYISETENEIDFRYLELIIEYNSRKDHIYDNIIRNYLIRENQIYYGNYTYFKNLGNKKIIKQPTSRVDTSPPHCIIS